MQFKILNFGCFIPKRGGQLANGIKCRAFFRQPPEKYRVTGMLFYFKTAFPLLLKKDQIIAQNSITAQFFVAEITE